MGVWTAEKEAQLEVVAQLPLSTKAGEICPAQQQWRADTKKCGRV